MSTQTNAISNPPLESNFAAPRVISSTQQMYWALRREFWENRAIYFAPLIVACVFLFGFLITGAHHLQRKMRGASALDSIQLHHQIEEPYDLAAAVLMGAFLIIAVFYCIEALQRERRDRSILFWKSLPVSDLTTVAAKASIPFLVLPFLCCAITLVTQFLMLLASCAVLAASGLSASTYWAQVSVVQMLLLLLYHVMTAHVLWSAPIYGWLLMVSAWARRAAVLWALLPPLVIGFLEKLLFNTNHFAAFMGHFLSGSGTEAIMAPNTMPMDPLTHVTPLKFLSTPGLWIGLAVTAVFLAAAVRLRRYRGPS